MKAKNLLLTALAAVSLFAGVVGLAACKGEELTPGPTPDAHTHNYGEWVVTVPTLTATGSAKKVCSGCEEGTDGHEVSVTLPVLTDSGYTKSGDTATCEGKGEATYTVTVEGNDFTFKGETAPKGHAYHEQAAVAETCTTDGNKKYYTCDNCTKVFDENKTECQENDWVIAKHHVYKEHAAVAPTCTAAGNSKYYTCEKCDKVFDENKSECQQNDWVLTQKSHTLGAQVAAKEATCTEDGNETYWQCTECHKYFKNAQASEEYGENEWVIAKHHTYHENAAVTPSCTTAGNKKYYTCEKCDKVFDENKTECKQNDWVLDATGHTYTWTATQEPTATTTGSAKAECSACGADNIGTAVLPALTQANVEEGKYTYDAVPATCENDGEGNYHTTDSVTKGGTLTFHVALPAIGHQWVCAEAPEAVADGGTVSATCANENCGETRAFPYIGTLAQTDTVTIAKAGQYYIKRTSGTAEIIFTIPIAKAGKYRVEFINLDKNEGAARRPVAMGSGSTTIHVNSKTQEKVAYATASAVPFAVDGNATILTGETIKPSYNSDVIELCWFEAQVDETFAGGTITFSIAADNSTESAPHPFLICVEIEEEKVLQEGDNSVVITGGGELVDEYLFKSEAGGWYEISISEETKTAVGSLIVYFKGTDVAIFDSARSLSARFEVKANSTNTLVFRANNRGTYTVKLAKSEKPAPTLKVGVIYDGNTAFSGSSSFKTFTMTVDASVAEGQYTLWFPLSSNRSYGNEASCPFSVRVGTSPTFTPFTLSGAKYSVKITVKGGDKVMIKSTASISEALNDVQLSK